MHIAECGKASLTIRFPIQDRDHRNIMNAPIFCWNSYHSQNIIQALHCTKGFLGALVVKIPPTIAGDKGDAGLIPESGRFPGGGHNNPLQYSCLRIPHTEEPVGYSPWGRRVGHD